MDSNLFERSALAPLFMLLALVHRELARRSDARYVHAAAARQPAGQWKVRGLRHAQAWRRYQGLAHEACPLPGARP